MAGEKTSTSDSLGDTSVTDTIRAASADPVPTLSPATFLDTLRMADRYQAMVDAGGWTALPADLVVKPGAGHPAIPALRKHLALVGDLAADAPMNDQLDATLVAAVKAFQARHGLPETGLIGRQTVAALNVPAATRQRQLAASAARQIGSNFAYGDRYVVVNIPSATVEAVDHGVVVRRYVAVVGKPDKATPRIEARITDVNLNPTWTLPVSIIKKEIIPKMRKDPGYLARERIRILGPGGVEVDPTAIDWSSEKAANYTLRQDSGLDNSLGQVRIDMPNRHAVYMHDTPAKGIFGDDFRFGCDRAGDFEFLQAAGQRHGFSVDASTTVEVLGGRVSSTRVRQALADHAEYGRWELHRTVVYISGRQKAWLRRKIIRVPRPPALPSR